MFSVLLDLCKTLKVAAKSLGRKYLLKVSIVSQGFYNFDIDIFLIGEIIVGDAFSFLGTLNFLKDVKRTLQKYWKKLYLIVVYLNLFCA